MKSVICPLCKRNILSENFKVGESFACPNCQNELTVQPYTDTPILKSALDCIETMGLAQGFWKEGRIMLSEQKLLALGQFVVGAVEMEKWSKESLEELEKRARRLENASRILADAGIKDEFYALNRSLLDLFLDTRRKSGS